MECHHDDYELVIHSTGEAKKMEDIDWDQMMEWMVAANVEKHGCIYENDDIIVEHQMLNYDSGDREALMPVHQLKDGLMWQPHYRNQRNPVICRNKQINALDVAEIGIKYLNVSAIKKHFVIGLL